MFGVSFDHLVADIESVIVASLKAVQDETDLNFYQLLREAPIDIQTFPEKARNLIKKVLPAVKPRVGALEWIFGNSNPVIYLLTGDPQIASQIVNQIWSVAELSQKISIIPFQTLPISVTDVFLFDVLTANWLPKSHSAKIHITDSLLSDSSPRL